MFRSAIRSIRAPVTRTAITRSTPLITPVRFYAAPPLTKEEIATRAIQALKTVASLQESNITLQSSFQKDLGLDSLDTVEALVALEEEFDLEIPDATAENLKTVGEAVDFFFKEESK
ncbi:Acyl carrier protein, mitochondrial [Candida viswanathii]|uniref:Acyl carrier protein n=1 Tax=Candida viswanathii TaxID=5486 RepID=A0A367XPU6_9ASCO|nr:Acyl carrier protein, mitochondrial [Candida viswanathii]